MLCKSYSLHRMQTELGKKQKYIDGLVRDCDNYFELYEDGEREIQKMQTEHQNEVAKLFELYEDWEPENQEMQTEHQHKVAKLEASIRK